MLINLQPMIMKDLNYSETELGRVEEIVLALFLEQGHPYGYVIADTDVLLRGFVMLYNTEKGSESSAIMNVDKLFEMLDKIKQKKYRPTEKERAHACNVIGMSFEKTAFYFISRRKDTIKMFLEDPNPFIYETERLANLRYFLAGIYKKFQGGLGTFVPFMYTTDYVPMHFVMQNAPVGLTKQERHYWYINKKREMMSNDAKRIAADIKMEKLRERLKKNQT